MVLDSIKNISDSHFHILEMIDKNIDISNFFENWKCNNGSFLIDIGVDELNFNKRLYFSNKFDFLYHSIGIHPNSADIDYENRLKKIEETLPNKKIIAIGETGLDYFRDIVNVEIQKKYLLGHIELSIKNNLPIIIHNRNASEDLLDILSNFKGQLSGVIHCFSDNHIIMKKFLDLGYYISFAGNSTYKKNTLLLDCIKNIPLDRLLLETDSPYLSPEPLRGRINTPENIIHTYNFVSKSLNIDINRIVKEVNKNIEILFRIKRLNE